MSPYRLLVIALLSFFVVLVALTVFGKNGILTVRRVQHEIAEVKQEIAQLKRQNQRLQERISAIQSNPALVEQLARQQLGFVRPGEVIYEFVPSEEEALSFPGEEPGFRGEEGDRGESP